ncbi:MAG: hypothetical protein QOG10_5847 [Kribbellaceae bacterium]|nr:hypothetical protein [Kribbellaceae bacterium]
MFTRGWKNARLAGTVGVATIGLLVACGNDLKPAADTTPTTTATSTPTVSTTPSTPTTTPREATPTTKPSTTVTPSVTPTVTPKPSLPPNQVRLTTSMLLTGSELSKGDPNRGWIARSGTPGTPKCGNSSTRGRNVLGSLTRDFYDGLAATGGQWLTRYKDNRAAIAAYERITATIKACKALRPAPTHARKLTENRSIEVGDATRILRWYDYPLPSDPGSEDGAFPYAVTVKGPVVSVLSFWEYGKGIKPANLERVAVSAGKRLTN